MLFLEVAAAGLAVSATAFGIFLHFWNKRKLADLEAEILKLQEKGIHIGMDTLLQTVSAKPEPEKV
ncbi:hypothetical protein OQ252_05275 [Acetobacter farinalis]|uniref:Uncharacterized protein n=1 Tax=Acetobacter farinalis TaxID=1260984 RepID=A0ABT3Q698_9PROT|nr:hypothetical protein [Acetobacter farinalis]MCX2560814.1 hypothetical protein [Acetobacter farinalis]NHO29465.1 hypothetical protein [Acetobacter farinalis]